MAAEVIRILYTSDDHIATSSFYPPIATPRDAALTRPKVDHNVDEENCVRKTIEGDPARAEVVVEERDGHGQDYQVGHEEQQHTKVPVKPAKQFQYNYFCYLVYQCISLECANLQSYVDETRDFTPRGFYNGHATTYMD